MVNYSKLGYHSIDEYNTDFYGGLLETNHTYDFFVDWKKVFFNLEDYLFEIDVLNTLNKVEPYEIESYFRNLLRQYPQIVPVLPIILAIREKNVLVLDVENNDFKKVKFSATSFNEDEIVEFCKKTGLLDLFSNINDLYSYLVGVEAGLDTNARKNRSGHIFEDIVGDVLAEKIKYHPEYRLGKEDTISFQRTKRWDYVIYKNNQPKLLFECNFYNSTGSKPIEVANAYVDLQNQIRETGLTFIWVTDGKGWKKMVKALQSVSDGIDYIINFKMLNERLEKIIF